MTTIDRAGLEEIERCARRFDLLAKDRNHPGVDPVVAARALRRIAALRKPDQKGEATDEALEDARAEGFQAAIEVVSQALEDLLGTPAERFHKYGIATIEERFVDKFKAIIAALNAAPQPAPEAGKLLSEEAIGFEIFAADFHPLDRQEGLVQARWDIDNSAYRPIEKAKALKTARTVIALLSPAQPHDVPCARCAGTSWVCENHPDRAWTAEGCECGAGMPCPDCDQRRQPPPHDVPAEDGDGLVARLRDAGSNRRRPASGFILGGTDALLFLEAADALEAQGRRIAAERRTALDEAIEIALECDKQDEIDNGAAATGAAGRVAEFLAACASRATSGRA